jgi:thiol-disulfide isomerase/thioredoxin
VKKLLVLIMTILMCVILAACAGDAPAGEDAEEDDYHYAVEDVAVGTNIGSFTSEDLEGNEVSEAIFGDKDVTVINVWATFCGPCIEEMPELAELAEGLPDNAQVIGVVIDATPAGTKEGAAIDLWGAGEGNIDLAKEICGDTGVKYTNILASESVSKAFESVEAVPTTFIVDKSGNTICTPFLGADVEGYKKVVDDYLAGL